jgi:Zn finger protein HypA/HybF involved in hydrogenase expression
MPDHQQERMRAIVAQALAHAARETPDKPLVEVHLDLYSGVTEEELCALFTEMARGTLAEGAAVVIRPCGTRYICWNCCGMRFEGWEGVCPNCGEDALEVPEDINFALYKVVFNR